MLKTSSVKSLLLLLAVPVLGPFRDVCTMERCLPLTLTWLASDCKLDVPDALKVFMENDKPANIVEGVSPEQNDLEQVLLREQGYKQRRQEYEQKLQESLQSGHDDADDDASPCAAAGGMPSDSLPSAEPLQGAPESIGSILQQPGIRHKANEVEGAPGISSLLDKATAADKIEDQAKAADILKGVNIQETGRKLQNIIHTTNFMEVLKANGGKLPDNAKDIANFVSAMHPTPHPSDPNAPARPDAMAWATGMGEVLLAVAQIMRVVGLIPYMQKTAYTLLFANSNWLTAPVPLSPLPYKEPSPDTEYYHAYGDWGDYGYENQGNSGYGCAGGGCAPWWWSWTKNKGQYFPFIHR